VARALVEAVRATGAGAFLADTAPLIYRLERRGDARHVAACDALFDEVDGGDLACLVSTLSAAELFVGAFRSGARAVAFLDAILRSPSVGLAPPTLEAATMGARWVAERRVGRLTDALIAATAHDLGVPLVTADRRLARATGALLVADFA